MDSATPVTSLDNSKKGQGLIFGIAATLLAGAAAVAVGGPAIIPSVIQYVIGGIVAMTTTHQIAQAQQDKAIANNAPCPPAPTSQASKQ